MPSRLIAALAALLPFLGGPAWSQTPPSASGRVSALVFIGERKIRSARPSEAQADCEAALKLDPASAAAQRCLDEVAARTIDQSLNEAEAKLASGDKAGAIALASKWTQDGASSGQQKRARDILNRAKSIGATGWMMVLIPDWLRQSLVTMVTLALVALALLIVRKLWREWKRGDWYGNLTNTTQWSMHPLKEQTAAGERTGIATDAVLDALARVGHEFQQPAWKPHLLLLRPTQPANFEPAIVSEFLSGGMDGLVLAPATDDLRVEWKLHDVRLDEAIQNLELKTSLGLDIGSVARFMLSLVRWFNAGEPVITGLVKIADGKSVSIHVAAQGGRVQAAAVTASTDMAPGIDATELSAKRVAFKFLLRMRYPDMTDDQIAGLAALRQGVTLFSQFAGTVPGLGEDAKIRTSSLATAAFNLSFFRASIPNHCNPGQSRDRRSSSLQITEEVRQAALLAEGVAHALVGTAEQRTCAVDCFRQLQDWPGSAQTDILRRQAAYNEAIVWAQTGSLARAVLMLTELLGERAPDTIAPGGQDAALPLREEKAPLPEAVRLPARVARAAAFARYNRDSWSAVPECRVKLVADDAVSLIQELDTACGLAETSAHDHRLLRYLYVETLRAAGHIELLRVIEASASRLYGSKRPVGLRNGALDQESSARLHNAISYMLTSEQLAPNSDLYCDLAESYLLLKEFTTAEGYARHAILESNSSNERAYYIAAESLWLANTARTKELARKYAADFKGVVTLEEFKALRAELTAEPAGSAAAATTRA